MDIPHIACNTGDPSALDLVTMIEDSLPPSATRLLDEAEQSRLVADIDAALPRVHRYAPATPSCAYLARFDERAGFTQSRVRAGDGIVQNSWGIECMTQLSSKGVDRVIAFSSGIMVSASPMPLAAWG